MVAGLAVRDGVPSQVGVGEGALGEGVGELIVPECLSVTHPARINKATERATSGEAGIARPGRRRSNGVFRSHMVIHRTSD